MGYGPFLNVQRATVGSMAPGFGKHWNDVQKMKSVNFNQKWSNFGPPENFILRIK